MDDHGSIVIENNRDHFPRSSGVINADSQYASRPIILNPHLLNPRFPQCHQLIVI